MKRHFYTCRQLAFLLTGVSVVATLSACEDLGINNPFGLNRPEQMVEGGRRTPALNDVSQGPSPAAPMVSQKYPGVKADPKVNPYDYYDDVGNVRGEQSSSTTPASTPASSVPQEGNVFTRFIDNIENKPAPSEPAVRKPLPGNLHYSLETQETAPIAPPPQPAAPLPDDGKAFPDNAIVRWNPSNPTPQPTPIVKPMPAKPVEEIPAPPVKKEESSHKNTAPAVTKPLVKTESGPAPVELLPEEKEVTDVEGKPAWSDRWLGEGTPEEKAAVAAKTADEPKRQYPSLSSVPPTPEEFKAVQSANREDVEALENDSAAAQATKNSLSAEGASIPVPSTEHKALLGGGSVPPPPFAAPPDSPSIVKKPVERSLWDQLFSSNDNSAPGASTSGLPSPQMLETTKPPQQ